eukprot:11181394-Ditylum_brightwellii.AAC.1
MESVHTRASKDVFTLHRSQKYAKLVRALVEELKYDISYNFRKSLIDFDNDAASCYNHILLNISSLVARK